MIFKPNIFISSTFKENEDVRKKVKDYFESIGANPLLYEYNLTPSTKPLTYQTDILQADFIILIIKKEYGTKTKSGLSGTHEEFEIAKNSGIPIHVYLQKNTEENTSEEQNEQETENILIDEIKNNGISYYYFEKDDDILEQIKRTTFIIAREITLNQITKNQLPKNVVTNLANNTDYNHAIEVISIIESMCKISRENALDFVYTDIFVQCLECIMYEFPENSHEFINWKLDEVLQEMLTIAREFISHSTTDFSTVGSPREFKFSVLGKLQIIKLSNTNYSAKWSLTDYENCLNHFFQKYEEFKKLVQDVKLEVDIIK